MKKKTILLLMLAVVCMVALGAVIYTKYTKNEIIYEYDEDTYIFEDTELGTEVNITSEDYTPTEIISE